MELSSKGRPPGIASLRLEGCVVDLPQQRVLRADASLPLTTKECEVLAYLAERPHTVVTRDELLRQVWGYTRPPDTRAVDLVIGRLRRKVELDGDAPRHIFTVTGAGYRFVPVQDAPASPVAPVAPGVPGPVVICVMEGSRLPSALALAEQLGRLNIPFLLDQASVGDARPGPTLEGASVLVWILPPGPLPQVAAELLRLTEGRRAQTGVPVVLPLVGPGATPAVTEFGPTCPGPLGWDVNPTGCAALIARLRVQPRPPWPLPPLHETVPPRASTPRSPSRSPDLQPAGARYSAAWHAPWADLEREAVHLLRVSGSPLVIQAARGGGRSWLLAHLLHARGDAPAVLLEPRVLGGPIIHSSEQLLPWLAQEIQDQLNLDVDMPDLSASGPLGARRAMDRWMERVVLPSVPKDLWLAWDDADKLRLNPGDDGVFQMLRSWASRLRPPWDRLRLLLTISTEPVLLLDRPELSPFNLTPPLRLGDLAPEAVADLAARHGAAHPEETAAALAEWVGGHPYLVRLALYAMATQGVALETLGSQAIQGQGPWGDPLRALLLRLRSNAPLGQAIGALVHDPTAPLDFETGHRLVQVGLLRTEGSGFQIRYPLYAQFLARHL